MASNSFDADVAVKVGMGAAVLYKNIAFWCEKNRANGRNIHEGKAWTYNSARAFASMFPYMTEKQIRTGLQRLVEHGFIEEGEFNKDNRDRTKWYADLANCICPTGNLHVPEKEGAPAREVTALPDIKPDIKHTTLLGAGVNMEDLSQRLCEAAGITDETKAPGLLNISEPLNWLENGCDLDKDIIPAIRSVAARGKRPTAWGYYSRAVFEAKQRREAPPPAVTVEGYTPKQKRETLTERVARLAAAK